MYYGKRQVKDTFVEIEYEGKDYALCMGTLVVRLNGVTYYGKLTSGGSVSFDDDWSEDVTEGPWSITMKDGFPSKFIGVVTDIVNSVVPWGCCGGCV